jgi:hypothetical protein
MVDMSYWHDFHYLPQGLVLATHRALELGNLLHLLDLKRDAAAALYCVKLLQAHLHNCVKQYAVSRSAPAVCACHVHCTKRPSPTTMGIMTLAAKHQHCERGLTCVADTPSTWAAICQMSPAGQDQISRLAMPSLHAAGHVCIYMREAYVTCISNTPSAALQAECDCFWHTLHRNLQSGCGLQKATTNRADSSIACVALEAV